MQLLRRNWLREHFLDPLAAVFVESGRTTVVWLWQKAKGRRIIDGESVNRFFGSNWIMVVELYRASDPFCRGSSLSAIFPFFRSIKL